MTDCGGGWRPRRLPRAYAWTALAALLMLSAGCGGGDGGRRVVSRLSGLVATIETGSPVIDAQVTVAGSTQATRTTVRGSYFLDTVQIRQGWNTLRAEKRIDGEVWNGERAVLIDPLVPIQSNLLIAIGPENRKGTIRGRVRTAAGAPLRNVTVFLNPEATVASAFRITDSRGEYEFRSVPAGTYTVVASARELVNGAANGVTVLPGDALTVNLVLLFASAGSIEPPTNLTAQAFTYPEASSAAQAQVRAVQRWLSARHRRPARAYRAQPFRIQDWPPGSIIEVALSWSPPAATDLAGYVLDRAGGTGLFGTIDRFADPTAMAYYDLDPVYTPDEVYQFRLSAVNTRAVQSPASDLASTRPLQPLAGLVQENSGSGPPVFSWRPVARALRYQVLVLSRPPDLADTDRMPLVWPPATDLALGQTAGTQVTYGGPDLQAGATYYWTVFAFDQADPVEAQAVSASEIRTFTTQ